MEIPPAKQKLLIHSLLIIIGITFLFTYLSGIVQADVSDIKWADLDLYADHHHTQPTPYLKITPTTGQVGSYFYVWGNEFPIYSDVTITVNDEDLGTITTNDYGYLDFELDTENAEEGYYVVTATVDAQPDLSASVSFTIDNDAPTKRPSSGEPEVFEVPAGIAYTEVIYLPLILR